MSDKEKKEPTSSEKVKGYLQWIKYSVIVLVIAQVIALFAK